MASTASSAVPPPHAAFPYQPLNKATREIRLIIFENSRQGIEIDMKTFPLDNAPPFMALSYVWGDPGITSPILLSGHPFQVTTNLASALARLSTLPFDSDSAAQKGGQTAAYAELIQELQYRAVAGDTRPTVPHHVWIDALCINQGDLDEKSSQIPMMYDIYAKSRHVVMWLGEETADSGAAIDLVLQWSTAARTAQSLLEEHLPSARVTRSRLEAVAGRELSFSDLVMIFAKHQAGRSAQNNRPVGDPFGPAKWKAISTLVNYRPYWRRLWIVQEIVAAASALVLCGGRGFLLDDLVAASYCWSRLTQDMVLGLEKRDMVIQSAWWSLDMLLTFRRRLPRIQEVPAFSSFESSIPNLNDPASPDENLRLEEVLQQTAGFEAREPRDKIYGLVGLIKSYTAPILPNYKAPLADVYAEFVRSHVEQTKDLSLVALGGIGCRKSTQTTGHPCWVPDFEDNKWGDRCILATKLTQYAASGNTKTDCLFSSGTRGFTASGILCDELDAVDAAEDTAEDIPDQNSYQADVHLWRWAKLAAGRRGSLQPGGCGWLQTLLCVLLQDSVVPYFEGPNYTVEKSERERYLGFAGAFVDFMSDLFLSFPMDEHKRSHINQVGPMMKAMEESPSRNEDFSNLGFNVMMLAAALTSDYSPKSETEVLRQLLPLTLIAQIQVAWRLRGHMEFDEMFNHVEFLLARKLVRARSFFVTKDGLMGQGPLGSRKGDKICVLLGCRCPLVVRPVEGGFVIVGGVFVHGMMNGEMMYKLRSGTSDLRLEKLTFLANPPA